MDKSIHLDDFIVISSTFSEVQDNYFIKEKNEQLEIEKQIKNLKEELEKKDNIINSLEIVISKQRDDSKKLTEDHQKLKKRHTELLKMMNELLKIKTNVDEKDNLDEIRDKIIATLYNELRRHTVLPFTVMIGNYNRTSSSDKTKNIVL
jgi:predicted nuclease with TOPRIM domain